MFALSYDPDGGLETPSNIFQKANSRFKPVSNLKLLVNFGSFKPGNVTGDKIAQTDKFFDVSSRDIAFDIRPLVCVLKRTTVSCVKSLVFSV